MAKYRPGSVGAGFESPQLHQARHCGNRVVGIVRILRADPEDGDDFVVFSDPDLGDELFDVDLEIPA
jgi:hypothetical protein